MVKFPRIQVEVPRRTLFPGYLNVFSDGVSLFNFC